ncbi:MAG: 2-oxo-4-hydroxy-4-carboxy-5-ureidoimidazoline decarboxylase [Halieaceae bacterium]|nr:2-oxo-4-hydroxy-4-carboxy-5-ureidoimidazoline decarboxylase [Halieaceae bacterium]
MSLQQLNTAAEPEARRCLLQCCASKTWVSRLLERRPFAGAAQLREAADRAWRGLSEKDYLQAFAGHPEIGDLNSLRARYADTSALAAGEQSGVEGASDELVEELQRGNRAYQEKFGFIFIVCATGKSAGEMLELLQQRLPNSREVELDNAVREQRKIFQLRLEKLL